MIRYAAAADGVMVAERGKGNVAATVHRVSLRSAAIQAWLDATRSVNGSYRHLRLSENREARAEALEELSRLVREAHADARLHWERLRGLSLDPLDPAAGRDTAMPAYPDSLHTITLQGYLGEVLAGLIAENFEPHAIQWYVPAFLFPTHAAAFQALERRRQLGGPAKRIPGRTGDDALAFSLDDEGTVRKWLWGEAKCTHDHNTTLIRDGHVQLSASFYLPVDLSLLVETLERRDDTESRAWAERLRLLLLQDAESAPPRYDMFVYVCGRGPVQNDDWLPTDSHSPHYTGERPLEAVELHLTADFDEVLITAYPVHTVDRG
jgi:hypothetical protein